MALCHYRPQRSCGQGNIFEPVCHSVHRGVVSHKALRQTPPRADTPWTRPPPPYQAHHPPRPGRHPPGQTPPGADPPGPGTSPRPNTHTPEQTPPWTRHTPHPTRHNPLEQTPPSPEQTLPGPGTTPLGPGTPPRPGTPPSRADTPKTRHTPPQSIHSPPRTRLRHTVYEWPVRILLQCILVL